MARAHHVEPLLLPADQHATSARIASPLGWQEEPFECFAPQISQMVNEEPCWAQALPQIRFEKYTLKNITNYIIVQNNIISNSSEPNLAKQNP